MTLAKRTRALLAIGSIALVLPIPWISSQTALAATPTPPPCQSVEEAVSQGLVRLTLSANGNLFFRDPLDYTIENISSETLDLCFPAGLIFVPADSQFQELMLTETVLISLAPGATKEGSLFADCINESRHAPEASAEYQLGSLAEGNLLKVAQAIDGRSAKARLGAQMAIWAVTDGFTLDDLKAPEEDQAGGLTSSIRPLLCLTTGEVELAQELLAGSESGIQLYTGENPLSTEYCQSQGIPTFDQLKQMGTRALLWVVIGLVVCVLVAGGILFLVIRLLRGRK